jgi:hypothetical protein
MFSAKVLRVLVLPVQKAKVAIASNPFSIETHKSSYFVFLIDGDQKENRTSNRQGYFFFKYSSMWNGISEIACEGKNPLSKIHESNESRPLFCCKDCADSKRQARRAIHVPTLTPGCVSIGQRQTAAWRVNNGFPLSPATPPTLLDRGS